MQNTPGVEQGGFLTVWDELGKALAKYPAAATENDLAPRVELAQAGDHRPTSSDAAGYRQPHASSRSE